MPTSEPSRMTLIEHFVEFRSRLIKSAIGILVALFGSWFLYNYAVKILTKPFCHHLPTSSNSHCGVLYINGVLGPLNLRLEVSFLLGLFISSPIWIYQLWAFVAPALHKSEKRYTLAFLLTGIPFFAAGAYLGYALVQPAVKFLLGFTPNTLTNLVRFDEYLNFVLRIVLLFGLAFELPVFLVALNFGGVLKGKSILKPWRLAVFGIILFSGLTVPTGDPLTMLVLAVPMIIFYFMAGFIGVFNDKKRAKNELFCEQEYEVQRDQS